MFSCKEQPHDVNILIDFFTKHLSRCPDNCPREKVSPVRVRVWFEVSVKIRVGWAISIGGNCPRTLITSYFRPVNIVKFLGTTFL